jgi:hypothetical protein
MPTHDPRSLMLLPALGLCSCVVSGELEASTAPEPMPAPAPGTTWIEADSPRQPLSMFEAASRSGHASLAAGHFAAAHESLQLAASLAPEAMDVRLAQVDALLGLRQFAAAKALLTELRADAAAQLVTAIDVQQVLVRELERAIGFTPCDAKVDQRRRPLARDDDFLAAWNQLRGGLPNTTEIPISSLDPRGRAGYGTPDEYERESSVQTIPSSVEQARDILCGEGRDCDPDEPRLIRLELEQEATVALVVPHADGSVSVLPDLVHPKWTTCGDDTVLSLERFGELLRVRVFSDSREEIDPSEWALDDSAALGSVVASAGYYAGSGSSGYQSSGYNSSGYQSSGYQSSGYNYSYGCGGGYDSDYDYEPYSCTATHTFERDMFINLARGEVVLDIVRSGASNSPLGQVTAGHSQIRVDACGVDDTLTLSWS